MSQLDFNEYSDNYREELQEAVAFSGKSVDFFAEAKAIQLLGAARRALGDPAGLKALDVGCGIGLMDRFLLSRFGALHGVDIAEEVIEKARQNNPGVHYRAYDGRSLPFSDGSFDLVFTACVLHCLEPAGWEHYLAEMARVTRRGGLTVVFEHNPMNPLTRLVVKRCVLAAGAHLLSPRETKRMLQKHGLRWVESKYFLLFPWAGNLSAKITHLLRRVPAGAQYYVAARK